MSLVFERAQADTHNFEKKSTFEQHFSRYNLEIGNCSKPRRYNPKIQFAGLGGVPLSWDAERGDVYVEQADAHTLVIGPTASKKSRLITMPTVRMLGAAKESMIISDPKSEIYNRTADYLEKEGYRILVLNLRDSKYGSSWNPLEIPYTFYCQGDIDRAYEFINDIAANITVMNRSEKDPFWDNSAGALFSGLTALLFKYCSEFSLPKSVVHIGSILHLRNILCSGRKSTIMNNPLWLYAKSDLHIASELIGTLETADDTRAGILSTFDQKMRIFSTQPNLTNMLSSNEISFDDIDQRPTALFLLLPDEKTTYHGLVSLFIKQSYEYIIFKTQERNRNHDAKLKIRLNYVLDEFSSLPTVKDFPAMITAARSRNIRFNIVIQSKHQLVLRYAEDTDTILSNCTNWIFLTSRELKFLEEISALCGQIQNRDVQKPVLSVAELQRFDKQRGEVLVLSGRFKPFVTCLPDIEVYDGSDTSRPIMHMRTVNPTDIVNIDMQKIRDKLLQDNNIDLQFSEISSQLLSPFSINGGQMNMLIPLIDSRIKKALLNTEIQSQGESLIDELIADLDKKISELDASTAEEEKALIDTEIQSQEQTFLDAFNTFLERKYGELDTEITKGKEAEKIESADGKPIDDTLVVSNSEEKNENKDAVPLFGDEFDEAIKNLENL